MSACVQGTQWARALELLEQVTVRPPFDGGVVGHFQIFTVGRLLFGYSFQFPLVSPVSFRAGMSSRPCCTLDALGLGFGPSFDILTNCMC